ncbi:hypothetical protein ABIA35_007662 [Catenulispora sp. MAP12-49]|uniref:DUF7660 family protein n=1 Tax=Catenulispora sp. MAP12-49 TaxID=3156302 RepID=UPI003511E7A5
MNDPYGVNDIEATTIDSREKLAAFIKLLARDFDVNAETWENASVGSFLDALARWLESAESWANNMKTYRPDLWTDVNTPSWPLVARALRVARTYQ